MYEPKHRLPGAIPDPGARRSALSFPETVDQPPSASATTRVRLPGGAPEGEAFRARPKFAPRVNRRGQLIAITQSSAPRYQTQSARRIERRAELADYLRRMSPAKRRVEFSSRDQRVHEMDREFRWSTDL